VTGRGPLRKETAAPRPLRGGGSTPQPGRLRAVAASSNHSKYEALFVDRPPAHLRRRYLQAGRSGRRSFGTHSVPAAVCTISRPMGLVVPSPEADWTPSQERTSRLHEASIADPLLASPESSDYGIPHDLGSQGLMGSAHQRNSPGSRLDSSSRYVRETMIFLVASTVSTVPGGVHTCPRTRRTP
jgi:hypothetical protein